MLLLRGIVIYYNTVFQNGKKCIMNDFRNYLEAKHIKFMQYLGCCARVYRQCLITSIYSWP